MRCRADLHTIYSKSSVRPSKRLQPSGRFRCRKPGKGSRFIDDAFVKAYNPNVSPPFWVECPKGNELGEGGWYDEDEIIERWPEVVPDP